MFYGVIGGLGLGAMYLPSVVIVSQYFEKKRGLATGLAGCGSGIGSMALPPLINWALSLHGWQGMVDRFYSKIESSFNLFSPCNAKIYTLTTSLLQQKRCFLVFGKSIGSLF